MRRLPRILLNANTPCLRTRPKSYSQLRQPWEPPELQQQSRSPRQDRREEHINRVAGYRPRVFDLAGEPARIGAAAASEL